MQVSGKHISRQFNKYLEYRKNEGKKDVQFGEQMRHVVNKGVQHIRSHTQGGRHAPPQFSRPKTITTMQAHRLARHAPIIQEAAARYNVPVELICGVILQESGGDPRARSHAGAKGLMQLMPETAKRFGVHDPYDPKQSIEGGARYLRFLMDRFGGNIELALAGYNAGEANVEKYGNKIPPFSETRQYVPNVLGYTQTMINILASRTEEVPSHARRV